MNRTTKERIAFIVTNALNAYIRTPAEGMDIKYLLHIAKNKDRLKIAIMKDLVKLKPIDGVYLKSDILSILAKHLNLEQDKYEKETNPDNTGDIPILSNSDTMA